MINILYVGIGHKTVPPYVQKPYWKAGNQVYLQISVNFLAFGSGSTFLIGPIRNRIQESQVNKDPDPQHWLPAHWKKMSYRYGPDQNSCFPWTSKHFYFTFKGKKRKIFLLSNSIEEDGESLQRNWKLKFISFAVMFFFSNILHFAYTPD